MFRAGKRAEHSGGRAVIVRRIGPDVGVRRAGKLNGTGNANGELDVGSARYIIGDAFDTLATLPDNSVDLVFSSPPFLALRSYLPADHPDKGKEIGSEATPADFLDTLLDVVEACDRVLAPHGSLCFELGDTFAGSGGAGGDYAEGGLRDGQEKFKGSQSRTGWHRPPTNPDHPRTADWRKEVAEDSGTPHGGNGWPLPKSLCGIPTLFAWSLAYGRNLLRPERTTPRWRIRNVVVWARPNPPVGSLGDKFRPATSYLTVACKSDKRWFDLDAVRQPGNSYDRVQGPNGTGKKSEMVAERGETHALTTPHDLVTNPAGAPPLDYWEIPTQPYAGSHYATWPQKLCVRPIKSMCPPFVCLGCGVALESVHACPNCGSTEFRNGLTLDVFAGSGTTLAVATGHGRDAIGIDLDARNAELALERVGPLFLTVEHLERDTVA